MGRDKNSPLPRISFGLKSAHKRTSRRRNDTRPACRGGALRGGTGSKEWAWCQLKHNQRQQCYSPDVVLKGKTFDPDVLGLPGSLVKCLHRRCTEQTEQVQPTHHNRQTDRRTDIQTDIQTDEQTDRQTNRQTVPCSACHYRLCGQSDMQRGLELTGGRLQRGLELTGGRLQIP